LTKMPQLRRIIELYSVHKDDQKFEKDEGESSFHGSTMLRPGSFLKDKTIDNRSIGKNSGSLTNRSNSFDSTVAGRTIQGRQQSIPKYSLGRRSGSTYSTTFDDSPDKRSKSKALNTNKNLRHEELKKYYKFPPIPKAEISEEFIKRNPIHARINDFNKIKDQHNFKKFQLNRTLDISNIQKVENHQEMKLKTKLTRKNSILKKIANNSILQNGLYEKRKGASISEIMKTSMDRPKVTFVQDTLHGVLQTSSDLKSEIKMQKYKRWGGIKIPNNHSGTFNKSKDIFGRWDDQRDGIFYQL